jgi:hypothetical protein
MDDTQRRLAARAYVKRARVAGMQVLLHVSTDDYRIKGGPAAVGHDVPAADRADRQLPPRAGRARLRHLGRGQPRQPADLRKPFAGRVVLPRDVPGGEAALPDVRGRRARRARPGRCRALDGRLHRRLSPTYRRRATVIGIHNYGDVNRKRTSFTERDHPPGAPVQPSRPLLADGDGRDRQAGPLVRVQHRPRGGPVELDVPPRPPVPDVLASPASTSTTGRAQVAMRASTPA